MRSKLIISIGVATVLIVEGMWLYAGLMLRSLWICIIALGIITFTIYFLYVRLRQRKKVKYPIVPPEGKTDIYFPRTDIPRPVYADFREMQRKKRRLEKIRKRTRRKN